MPSPFPGMGPYLEAHWRDVHASLIIYARDTLQGVLPDSLRARVEERVILEAPQGYKDHPLYPDVRVVEFAPRREVPPQREAGVAVAGPVLVPVADEPVENLARNQDKGCQCAPWKGVDLQWVQFPPGNWDKGCQFILSVATCGG